MKMFARMSYLYNKVTMSIGIRVNSEYSFNHQFDTLCSEAFGKTES